MSFLSKGIRMDINKVDLFYVCSIVRLLINAKIKAILGEKEVIIKENDHVTSRNA